MIHSHHCENTENFLPDCTSYFGTEKPYILLPKDMCFSVIRVLLFSTPGVEYHSKKQQSEANGTCLLLVGNDLFDLICSN